MTLRIDLWRDAGDTGVDLWRDVGGTEDRPMEGRW